MKRRFNSDVCVVPAQSGDLRAADRLTDKGVRRVSQVSCRPKEASPEFWSGTLLVKCADIVKAWKYKAANKILTLAVRNPDEGE